jgi:hypothetical protein
MLQQLRQIAQDAVGCSDGYGAMWSHEGGGLRAQATMPGRLAVLVDEFDKPGVQGRATFGEWPLGVAGVELAEHGSHKWAANQTLQAGTANGAQEIFGRCPGSVKVESSEPLGSHRTQVRRGEGQQRVASGGRAEDCQFALGRGANWDHDLVARGILGSEDLQQAASGVLCGDLVQCVNQDKPSGLVSRASTEEFCGERLFQPRSQVGAGRSGQCDGQGLRPIGVHDER